MEDSGKQKDDRKKEKLTTQGETLRCLDEAQRRDNWENLELREKKRWNNWDREFIRCEQTLEDESIAWMKQEEELPYAYPSPI